MSLSDKTSIQSFGVTVAPCYLPAVGGTTQRFVGRRGKSGFRAAPGMIAPGSVGSQRSFLFHGSVGLRSGGRLDPPPHQRWSPQRDDQGQSKEHQSQDGVEGGKEWNVCADGRKDFCLEEVDPQHEPGETFLRRREPPQIRKADQEQRQKSESVTERAMDAPKGLPGEEAQAYEEDLDNNGDGEQPGVDHVHHPYPFTHGVPPLRAQMARWCLLHS